MSGKSNSREESLSSEVERLATAFMSVSFSSAADLWRFQLDLLAVQRDIQGEIGNIKRMPLPRGEKKESLDRFRNLRWQAKRLGDAFGWALLGGSQKTIQSLSENEKTPISPRESDQDLALIVVAQQLANTRNVFPLLHDVTDVLRIGDITFIDVHDSRRRHSTVEVKSRVIEERIDQGKRSLECRVSLISPTSLDHLIAGDWTPDIDDSPVDQSLGPAEENSGPTKNNPRTARQIKRMSRAFRLQNAIDGELVEIEGELPSLSIPVKSGIDPDWQLVDRLLQRARLVGYAFEQLDDAVGVAAFYSRDEVNVQTVIDTHILKDIEGMALQAGLPGSLAIFSIPDVERERPALHLPFHLYPIPLNNRIDLAAGRLAIFIFLMTGPVYNALEAAGFTVVQPTENPASTPPYLLVSKYVDYPNEGRIRVEFNPFSLIADVVYEFRNTEHLVNASIVQAQSMAATFYARISGSNDRDD
ncbi:hypothetical protein [Pseudofrankia sp. BMG5.37]|uniref:hypothetical protein n=1 Tax=Pseudofrankia sp. BMG5.37 TaxID=3050035 RepID=UPI0028946354|nr:hypothetical protein [Pseudofrankia sp. BMG5.37]MDT3443147.1 hypothetical protein [Pseudofrankia sp. BMG5.37]